MPKEVLLSLIALGGVLISSAISWIISRRQVVAEVEHLRLEIQRSYATNLNNKRLGVYPNLYRLLNDYTLSIQTRSLSFENLRTFQHELSEWYSQNGLFLSARTNEVLYVLLRTIRGIARKSDIAFANRLDSPEKRRRLITEAWKLQIGLKNDIGVYQVEFYDPEKTFNSYDEIEERLNAAE
jgi:hypothetical protein